MWVLDESYKQLYIKTKLIFECNYEHFKQKFGLISEVGLVLKFGWVKLELEQR